MDNGIPRLAGFLIRRVPEDRRLDVVGDLVEAHADRSGRMGPIQAWLATVCDALFVAVAFRWMRTRAGGGSESLIPFEGLRFDVRIAARGLRRNPTYTAVSATTIAVGMAATTAVLALSNAVLVRPPAISEPDRVWAIWEFREDNVRESMEGRLLRYERFEAYRGHTTTVLEGLAGHAYASVSLGEAGAGTSVVRGFRTSGNYFELLGVAPARGRFYSSDDEASIVLSDRLWRTRFGADPDLIGRTVMVDSQPFSVAGIAPADFVGTMTAFTGDVWIPWNAYVRLTAFDDDDRYVVPLARLADGVTREVAEARIAEAARAIEPRSSSSNVSGARLDGLQWREDLKEDLVLGAIALLSTAALLLLVAIANIAGMTMARAHDRQKEVAVRLAIGGSGARLVRQMLLETILISLIGGGAGVLLATAATGTLSRLDVPLDATVSIDASPDPWVLVASFLVAALAGALFGLGPALRSARIDLTTSLKDGSQQAGRGIARSAFVVGQLSASTVLLVIAGLFVRSFQEAIAVPLGFDPNDVSVATMTLGSLDYSREEGEAFYAEVAESIRAIPGVEAAGMASFVLLGGANANNEGRAVDGPNADVPVTIHYNIVDPGYLAATGLELVSGRFLTSSDVRDLPRVAVVNERLAGTLWPGEAALGRTFRIGRVEHEVVGVVRDGVYVFLVEDPRHFAYFPSGQRYSGSQSLHVKFAGPSDEIFETIRQTVASIDPDVPISGLRTMDEVIYSNGFGLRFVAMLTVAFAGVGLLLGAVGVYGLLAVQVARRSRELGVRMALGAQSPDLVFMVVRRGFRVATMGCVVGVGISIVVGRLIETLLYGIRPFDLPTFVLVPTVLIAAAVLASMFPARRATRVSPMLPLKGE